MPIGFKASSEEKKEKKKLKKIDSLQILLNEELKAVDTFEEQLNIEFREVEDLKNNLKVVQQQLAVIRNLIKRREEVISNLLEESEKPKIEINLEDCHAYFDLIKGVDAKLGPLLSLVYKELSRLYVDETHKLYKESKANSDKMHEIDKAARKLTAEIKLMHKKIEVYASELQERYAGLQKLAAERKSRPEKKPPLGFKV